MPNIFSRPAADEYPERFGPEIELVSYDELLSGLEDSFQKTSAFLRALPPEKLHYRYQAEKWTIQQLWQHVLDVERVLSYRALRYARHDETVLHGFDEKRYADFSNANARSWASILEEYAAVRVSTLLLFKSFDAGMAMRRGTAGKSELTVRAVGFLILGHETHHVRTIRERYL